MPERRFAPGSTALYAVLWLAVVIHGWSPLAAQDSMAWLRSPGDSAARKTSRDLELAEANDRASALERWSLGFLVGSRDEALGEAIDTQRQVLAYLDAQGSRTEATRARLAVLLVEAGESEAGPESPVGLDDWYADALERQRAVAAGDRAGAAFLTDQIVERGLRWKRHSQALVAAKFALVVVGLVLATARIRVFRELLRGSPAGPPWSLEDGIGVFVRGDSNGSGTVELADAITALLWLFRAENRPNCMESSDTDANGVLNLADPIGLLIRHLFIEGAAVPAPPCPACGQRYLYAFDC